MELYPAPGLTCGDTPPLGRHILPMSIYQERAGVPFANTRKLYLPDALSWRSLASQTADLVLQFPDPGFGLDASFPFLIQRLAFLGEGLA